MGNNAQSIDRDRLHMVPRDQAAVLAHKSLRYIQTFPAEEMVVGVGVLFATLCHRAALDPQEVHTMAMRMLRENQPAHFKTNDSLQSLRDFAGLRVAGEERVLEP